MPELLMDKLSEAITEIDPGRFVRGMIGANSTATLFQPKKMMSAMPISALVALGIISPQLSGELMRTNTVPMAQYQDYTEGAELLTNSAFVLPWNTTEQRQEASRSMSHKLPLEDEQAKTDDFNITSPSSVLHQYSNFRTSDVRPRVRPSYFSDQPVRLEKRRPKVFVSNVLTHSRVSPPIDREDEI